MKNRNEVGHSSSEQENNPEQEKIKELMERSRQFVVVVGPSGSGKTMAIKYMVEKYGFVEPPFLTTRELRPGEQEMGAVCLDREDFAKKETENKIFLPAHNYGNAYGCDLDVIFSLAKEGKNIIVEAPAANLTTDVSRFLPEGTVIGILPGSKEELERQLIERGLNHEEDRNSRLQSFEAIREQILVAAKSMDIKQIVPMHGIPKETFFQIDGLMEEKGFKLKK